MLMFILGFIVGGMMGAFFMALLQSRRSNEDEEGVSRETFGRHDDD